MEAQTAQILNRFAPVEHHVEFKRCRRCDVRKAVWAFYRERSCRGGRRPECKRCHARWRRSHYEPKTGRRYMTRRDMAERRIQAAEAEKHGRAEAGAD